MIDKLAAIPLAAQPGTDWRYGHSVNVQGYIVEKLSGMPLDGFLAKRILSPLKMNDTGFWVEPSKLGRVSRLHTYGADKRITSAPDGFDISKKPVFLSGSGGLLSTAEDYWRFSQMLLNGGELDGARLLKRQTVELMRTNVLAPGVKVDTFATPSRASALASTSRSSWIPRRSARPTAATRSTGAARSGPGSGSIRPTTSSSSG